MSENNLQTRQTEFTSYEQRGPQDGGDSTKDKVVGTVSEKVDQAKEKASEFAEQAQERVDEGKDKAADAMQQAADTLRERTTGSSGLAAEAGEKLATGMEKAAAYTHDRTTAEILNDLEAYVKEHPTQAVVGAVFAGFLLGRILR